MFGFLVLKKNAIFEFIVMFLSLINWKSRFTRTAFFMPKNIYGEKGGIYGIYGI